MSANLPIRLMAEKHQGEWVTFRTAQGLKRGILERVDGGRALVKFPYEEAPMHLLIGEGHDFLPSSDTKRDQLDAQHVGYYAPGGVGYGPGVAAPYGAGWGACGWWWIWIPIFFLALAVFLW